MLSAAVLRQLRRLTLKTRRAARERLAGHYEGAIRGTGLSFADVRPYEPGDDIRRLDWNVTARTGVPHIKRFIEERERLIYLCVDVSGSQNFGSGVITKRTVACELAALLAFAAQSRSDRVGLTMFTDKIELRIPPAKGERHVQRLTRELFTLTPGSSRTDLIPILTLLRQCPRGIIFLVSDFRADGWERALRVAARKHDVIAIYVTDLREFELPNIGRIRVSDAETAQMMIINTSQSFTRKEYSRLALIRRQETLAKLRLAGADVLQVCTSGRHLNALLQFFQARERQR